MFIFIVLFISCYYFFKILKFFSCSGMFRNVPECSMFLVLSTASVKFKVPQVVVRSQTAVVSDMKVVHKIRSERF